jgi:hypothetical protein
MFCNTIFFKIQLVDLYIRNTSYDTPKCNLCPSIGVKYILIILKKSVQINIRKMKISAVLGRMRLKCDGTRAETRYSLSAKRTSPFKSAGCQFSRLVAGKLCTSACRVCTARASLCSAVM